MNARQIAIAFLKLPMTHRIALGRQLGVMDGIEIGDPYLSPTLSIDILTAVRNANKVEELADLLFPVRELPLVVTASDERLSRAWTAAYKVLENNGLVDKIPNPRSLAYVMAKAALGAADSPQDGEQNESQI